jgi:ATP-dependent RNA helicase DDX60
VVFHGIPLSKVYRLLASRIPGIYIRFSSLTIDLVGHFPITTTLVSRLLQILTATDLDSDYGRKAVRGLLEQSRISLGSDHSRQQVLHHFRFSIEYLLRQNLINSSGESVALAGLISHLYYTEPANFALAELLRSGVFHRICGTFDPAKPDSRILEAMVHVLAHLFGRRIRKAADQEELETKIKRSPSNVILEPLPEDALMVLTNHNANIVKIYRAYAIRFGRYEFESTEKSLPLSRRSFNADNPCNSMVTEGLRQSAIKYAARSAFVATSGHGDSFETIDDLAHNTRKGILVEASAVPSMDSFVNPPVLDAYLLDFFKHGQVQALVDGNGLRRSDVWYVLDDFDRVLGAIDESLKLVAQGVEIDFPGDEMKAYGANKEADLVWESDDDDTESTEGDLSSEDRKVCEAFSFLRQEFRIRFKKMWA